MQLDSKKVFSVPLKSRHGPSSHCFVRIVELNLTFSPVEFQIECLWTGTSEWVLPKSYIDAKWKKYPSIYRRRDVRGC